MDTNPRWVANYHDTDHYTATNGNEVFSCLTKEDAERLALYLNQQYAKNQVDVSARAMLSEQLKNAWAQRETWEGRYYQAMSQLGFTREQADPSKAVAD